MRSYLYETQLFVAAVAALVLFAFGPGDETYLAGKSLNFSVMQQAEQRAEDFKADLKRNLTSIQDHAQSTADALSLSFDVSASQGKSSVFPLPRE